MPHKLHPTLELSASWVKKSNVFQLSKLSDYFFSLLCVTKIKMIISLAYYLALYSNIL